MEKITLGTPYNIELKTTANIDGYKACVYLDEVDGLDVSFGVELKHVKDYDYSFTFPTELNILHEKSATLKLYVYHENSVFEAFKCKTKIFGMPEVTVKNKTEFSVNIKPATVIEETPEKESLKNDEQKPAEPKKKIFNDTDIKDRVKNLLKSKA